MIENEALLVPMFGRCLQNALRDAELAARHDLGWRSSRVHLYGEQLQLLAEGLDLPVPFTAHKPRNQWEFALYPDTPGQLVELSMQTSNKDRRETLDALETLVPEFMAGGSQREVTRSEVTVLDGEYPLQNLTGEEPPCSLILEWWSERHSFAAPAKEVYEFLAPIVDQWLRAVDANELDLVRQQDALNGVVIGSYVFPLQREGRKCLEDARNSSASDPPPGSESKDPVDEKQLAVEWRRRYEAWKNDLPVGTDQRKYYELFHLHLTEADTEFLWTLEELKHVLERGKSLLRSRRTK